MRKTGRALLHTLPRYWAQISPDDLQLIADTNFNPATARDAQRRIIDVWCAWRNFTTTDATLTRLRRIGRNPLKTIQCDCWGKPGRFVPQDGAVFKDRKRRIVVASHERDFDNRTTDLEALAAERGLRLEVCREFPSWHYSRDGKLTIVVWQRPV